MSSVLLMGKNGSGKTTVAMALEKLQRIARGTNRVGDLLKPADFTRGRTDLPMRFEIEVVIDEKPYSYTIAFEYPKGFKELRVLEEKLAVAGKPIYTRDSAKVHLARPGAQVAEASFFIDWHLVALPVVQQRSTNDPVSIFKEWLARMLILRPLPSLIKGYSEGETLQPNLQVTDFGAWFSGLLAQAPSAYSGIEEYLKQVMPDIGDITNPTVGPESRSLMVEFSSEQMRFKLPFEELSDGEKCFMICALVLAANKAYGPLFCFWDEPDNHLALEEVGHLVLNLRRAFQNRGQFITTSHNTEAISRFSESTTLLLYRKSHLEPTIVRPLSEISINGDLVSAISRGDLQP